MDVNHSRAVRKPALHTRPAPCHTVAPWAVEGESEHLHAALWRRAEHGARHLRAGPRLQAALPGKSHSRVLFALQGAAGGGASLPLPAGVAGRA